MCACVTWLRRVHLSPLGSQTVLPAYGRVLDKAGDVAEQLAEAHGGGVVHGVVEQGGPPQVGLLPQQHAVQAGQALLCGVGRLQAQLLPADSRAPRLQVVVHPAQVVGAFKVTYHTTRCEWDQPLQAFFRKSISKINC